MNLPNFTPPPPGAVNIKTFQDLRTFLINYIVNTWMQYVNGYFQNQMLPVLNTATYNYGPDIASAATITPTAAVQRITGTVAINTITPVPTAQVNFAGPFFAIAEDGFSTTTAGNILLAVSVPANHMAVFAYHPVMSKWGVVTS